MQAVGGTLSSAGVAAIYLVHGTVFGEDPLGVLCAMARVWPGLAKKLRTFQKRTADTLAGEFGNYLPNFATEFEQALCIEGRVLLPVRLFHWSSENHHVGRADGAVRLIDELVSRPFKPGQRVLLWGHSHGGNVFALVTNLLAADVITRERFFSAAKSYFHSPLSRLTDLPLWERVHKLLSQPGNPLANVALDFVTFGTPVRYGWDSDGYSRLLHFIHHRPISEDQPFRAPFPPSIDDIWSAAHGDVVQQLGVAGTNVPRNFIAWRTWLADGRLNRLLQSGIRRLDVLGALRDGFRLPDEGVVLLVDYGPMTGNLAQHMAGHAIYTKLEWLLFHAQEVAKRLYP